VVAAVVVVVVGIYMLAGPFSSNFPVAAGISDDDGPETM